MDSVAFTDKPGGTEATAVGFVDTTWVLSDEADDACVELPSEPSFTEEPSAKDSVVFPTEESALVVARGVTVDSAVFITTLDDAEVNVGDINDNSCLLVALEACALVDSDGLSKAAVAVLDVMPDLAAEDAVVSEGMLPEPDAVETGCVSVSVVE